MSGTQALQLYRKVLKEASQILDYNLQAYIRRRSGEMIRERRTISDTKQIEAFLLEGHNELEIIRRQRIVQNLYFSKQNILQSPKN